MTRNFIKNQFKKFPHFSYNNWEIMYNHSRLVEKLSYKIAKNIKCDKELIAIAALLHDIGKTVVADEKTLHIKHQEFNLKISLDLIESLRYEKPRLNKLKKLISYTSDSVEMKVIKDADTLALYFDKNLYMLFVDWASKRNLNWAIERKIKKFKKLNFPISKKMGAGPLIKMKKDWERYLSKS
jgi:putative nucleotidyltransferase with HDIG domain